ncbi:acyl-ACP thioesterase [Roseomonas terrae]|uniref:Acyl-ACP thioesterase n=1 Tax=Neoroseomonas terrae TaxID=424799 RepID=A0ABS5EJ65_9PROT|nr:acyl-ACP thioesterase [Neoroseomonas terrae]
MIVIGRGSVQQEECDVMGHMNVRHYVARAADALAWLALEAGLPPSRGRLAVVDQHLRFLRELAPGTPFIIRGGVLRLGVDRLRTVVEIRNNAADAPAATLVTDLGVWAGPEGGLAALPAELEARSLLVEMPAHAGPRGLGFDPPAPLPDRAAAQAMGLTEGYRGAVRPHECDPDGTMRADVIIARIWDGVPNLRNRGTGLGIKEEGMGSAALEYRVAQFQPLRAGQLLTVCSGLKALGEKTTTWTHLVHDGETGVIVAAAEAVGIAFDLKARKAVAIPAERRAALESLLVRGLGL